ncbi:DUF1667 domain-containing protein [Candidatus Bipolaricaulota bacterium]|nr:DUF1667 domain-containing protein [Candidatus Bipolaricaulota bacterium]
MIRELTCISCPIGCRLQVEVSERGVEKIEGNRCPRGEAYAREEITDPKRILTTSVKVSGGDYPLVSVRTDKPIPKRLIPAAMEVLRALSLEAPLEIGQVLVPDLLGTGARVIATRTVRRVSQEKRMPAWPETATPR